MQIFIYMKIYEQVSEWRHQCRGVGGRVVQGGAGSRAQINQAHYAQ